MKGRRSCTKARSVDQAGETWEGINPLPSGGLGVQPAYSFKINGKLYGF